MQPQRPANPLDLLSRHRPPQAPWQVVVQVTGGATTVHDLEAPTVRIGRLEENEIAIPVPYVSRYQAVLEHTTGGYRLSAATEATVPLIYRGRALQAPVQLEAGDFVRISGGEGEMVTLVFLPVEPAGAVEGVLPLPAGERLRVGRAPENDLGAGSGMLEPYHVELEVIGDRVWLSPLAGLTQLNDATVSEPIGLTRNDVVRVGTLRLTVEDDGIHYRDRGSAMLVTSRRARTVPEDLLASVRRHGGVRIEARGMQKCVRGGNLLQDISLRINPGEFVILVGLSGAGKTTLMQALAGYSPATSGRLTVDGVDLYRNFDTFRPTIGFVPQRDIIHMDLTVFEALDYAAQLRLPPGTTEIERHQRVEAVMADLDLSDRRDVRIQALSGGQQKRVSIGVELLTSPGMFFLDEPTSGLDPGTETELMRLMRNLADQGRTIIMITHATKNVMLADKVLFMVRGGHMAWFGPPGEALTYFSVQRPEREQLDRPLEFDSIYSLLELETVRPEEWAERYREHSAYRTYIAGPLRLDQDGYTCEKSAPRKPPQVSALRQLAVLSGRNLTLLGRDRFALLLMLVAAPLLAGLDFLITTRDMYDPVHGNSLRITITIGTLVVNGMLVGALGQTREIIKDTNIYRRERLVNLGIGPYVLSKVWIAALLALYQAAAWVAVRYIAVQMPGGLGDAAGIYVTMWLTVLAGMMLGLFASAVAPSEDSVTLIVALLIIPQVLFNGSLLPLPMLSAPARMQTAVMPARWAFETLMTQTAAGKNIDSAVCRGDRIVTACPFPGIRAYDSPVIHQPRPVHPTPPSTSALIANPPIGPQQYTTRVNAYLHAEQRYSRQLNSYERTYATWKEARTSHLVAARTILNTARKDFGDIYHVSVAGHWLILSLEIVALIAIVFGVQRAKDAL